ncbi:NAD-binding protein [Schizopora paradoxa]|uniref:NAD-binding protein n=1 Tax=Schizopora paradoxa TaxID=27342 RepID=A0A0H2S322_9AGAM|nr:NAD-binding protein [Schizopora paradoxa]
MPSYAITGTSRGIGFGFVRALSADANNTVFALVRDFSTAGQLLDFVKGHPHKNIHVIEADIADINSIKDAAQRVSELSGGKLDVLINNAALNLLDHERGHLTIDAFPSEETIDEDFTLYFKTNTLGPIHTMNAFVPLLRRGEMKKCIVMSTTSGSPKVVLQSGISQFIGYSISKAGLNLAIAKTAGRFKDEGLIFVSVIPGMVKTIPGSDEENEKFFKPFVAKIREVYPHFEGPITIERSVEDMISLINRLTIADSGKFIHRDGRDGDSE